MNKALYCLSLIVFAASCRKDDAAKLKTASEIESFVKTGMLDKWYPQSMDTVYGGFLSTFTFDFKPSGDQDKMIVTQSRHTWTNAKASLRYPQNPDYAKGARHGFQFLQNSMWDKKSGGFFWLVDRQGNVKNQDSSKTAYGNAFAIYALAAHYGASGDPAALELAKKAFMWLEDHSHDKVYNGYFQHLSADGTPVVRSIDTPSTADTGYKDQNSSIHLLEAFTELYAVWPDPLVRERLNEMLVLIRDTMVTPTGYMNLFFTPDFVPVSFRNSSKDEILKHHSLDHVSFGHDIETAFLLMEASHVLGLKHDTTTMRVAKRMVDHCIANGWDMTVGGFYDEGYYFMEASGITITHDSKNWWAQVEGLNTLLLMSDLYPDDPIKYYQKFQQQWRYIDMYLVDHEHGDLFAGGIDKQPEMKMALKGHIWKAIYHQYRSLTHCVDRLNGKANF